GPDEARRIERPLLVLLDVVGVHWGDGSVEQRGEEEALGLTERDDQRGRILRLHAQVVPQLLQLGWVLALAAEQLLRSLDALDDVGVRRGRGRIEQPLEGVLEVRRRQRRAIAPLEAGTKVKGVRLAVRRDVPLLGQTGRDVEVLVRRDQRAVELHEHEVLGRVLIARRIDALRLVADVVANGRGWRGAAACAGRAGAARARRAGGG